MRYVHYEEFQAEGMASCPGGKYFQDTEISAEYRNVDCTDAAQGYKHLQGKED